MKPQIINNQPNFYRYFLMVGSLVVVILGPMIGFYGIQSAKYNNSSVRADIALLFLATFIIFSSLLCIYGAYNQKFRILLFVLYLNTLLSAYVLVCGVGIITFQPDLQKYVDNNWKTILKQGQKSLTKQQFKEQLAKDSLSLFVYIIVVTGIWILVNICLFLWIGFRRILTIILPSLSIHMVVYGIGLATTGLNIYFFNYLELQSKINVMSIVLIIGGTFMIALGCLGYYASTYNRLRILKWFLIITLALNCLGVLFSILLMILKDKLVKKQWQNYGAPIQKAGINKIQFVHYSELNLKLAGLYFISYFSVSTAGLIGSYINLKQNQQ